MNAIWVKYVQLYPKHINFEAVLSDSIQDRLLTPISVCKAWETEVIHHFQSLLVVDGLVLSIVYSEQSLSQIPIPGRIWKIIE